MAFYNYNNPALYHLRVVHRAIKRKVDIDNHISAKSQKLLIYANKEHILVNTTEIEYIKAAGNYSEIFLVNSQRLFTSKGLADIERALSSGCLMRVHHSYLVNPDQVQALTSNNTLRLQSQTIISVSRRKLKEIKNTLTAITKNK